MTWGQELAHTLGSEGRGARALEEGGEVSRSPARQKDLFRSHGRRTTRSPSARGRAADGRDDDVLRQLLRLGAVSLKVAVRSAHNPKSGRHRSRGERAARCAFFALRNRPTLGWPRHDTARSLGAVAIPETNSALRRMSVFSRRPNRSTSSSSRPY